MIAVMGATGRTGKKITEILLAAGHQVRALGRSRPELIELQQAGAETLMGEWAEAGFLTKAFRGVDAVYVMTAADPAAPDCRADDDRKGQATVAAIRECGVGHVVALSSIGGDLGEGHGLLSNWYAQEQRLRRCDGLNLMLLRPGLFFDNFFGALGSIRHLGYVADSLAPDLAMPWVSSRDIAKVAASALLALDWKGTLVRELLGPCDLTYAEATRIIGERIGLPGLRYVQYAYDEQIGKMTQAGASRSFATLYVEMMRAVNQGKVKTGTERMPASVTPVRLEDFAREFAQTTSMC